MNVTHYKFFFVGEEASGKGNESSTDFFLLAIREKVKKELTPLSRQNELEKLCFMLQGA